MQLTLFPFRDGRPLGPRVRPYTRRPWRAPLESPGPGQGFPGTARAKEGGSSAGWRPGKAKLGHSGPVSDAGPTLVGRHSHPVNHGIAWAFAVGTLASASLHIVKTT